MAGSMKAKAMTLADLKPAPYNPRRIGDAAKVALSKSLGEFGDISGLVWNKRSGTLVAGHQRLDALKAEHGEALKIIDGAVVTPSGERFPVRVVDWPLVKEKAANVAANSPLLAGEFTSDLSAILDDIKIELPDLVDALMLDDLLTDGTDSDGGPSVKEKMVGRPIERVWVLMGIPVTAWSEVAESISAIGGREGVFCETTTRDDDEKKG